MVISAGLGAPFMSVRGWFKWMPRKRSLLHNVASEINLLKLGKHLPTHVLSTPQVEEVFAAKAPSSGLGLRDRAMLETLYSTGVGLTELTNLQLTDINEERGVLTVQQSKRKRDRVGPIGERALRWLWKYNADLRPKRVVKETERTVFLTRLGDAFSANSPSSLVAAYIR